MGSKQDEFIVEEPEDQVAYVAILRLLFSESSVLEANEPDDSV